MLSVTLGGIARAPFDANRGKKRCEPTRWIFAENKGRALFILSKLKGYTAQSFLQNRNLILGSPSKNEYFDYVEERYPSKSKISSILKTKILNASASHSASHFGYITKTVLGCFNY